jgi:hypothetical protein
MSQEINDYRDAELVSACCGGGIDTDIPICQECGEWSEAVKEDEEEIHRYQSISYSDYWRKIIDAVGIDKAANRLITIRTAYTSSIHYEHLIKLLK